MKLVLLGTTGYHPNDLRETACLFLPEVGVVLDAGTGIYRLPAYLQTQRLDIFLTHAHLDHVIGLTFLLGMARRHRLRPVVVHGEPEKLRAVQEHLYAPLLFPVPPDFEFRALAPAVALPGGGTLTHFPLVHPGGSVGFRLDFAGHSLAYVTDTTAGPNCQYLPHIQGVDLLVHECYFADDEAEWSEATGHSHTSAVAEVAKAAGVGRLYLVHLAPHRAQRDPIGLQAARAIFPQSYLGEDLLQIEF